MNKNPILNSINSNSNNNKPPAPAQSSIEIGPYTIKNSQKPKLETLDSLENGDQNRNKERISAKESQKIQKEEIKEKLLRLESNDSFIRETDSSSITSENDSVLCYIDDLEHENYIRNAQIFNQDSLNNKTIQPYSDSFQMQQDTNK